MTFAPPAGVAVGGIRDRHMKRREERSEKRKNDPHDDPFFFPNRSWHFQLAALALKFKQGGHYFEGNYPQCKIENDPWVPEAPYFSNWVSGDLGTAAPVITRPGIVAGGQNLDGITGFTIGDKDNKCGVEGKTVIVHLSSASGGTRAACGVLEAV